MASFAQQTSILVVDGDSDARGRLGAGLSEDRFRVIDTGDLESGLSAVRLLKPELVVLRLPVPQGDDGELVRRFREVSAAPIIVLADSQDWRAHAESLRQGADYVLPSSVSVRELRSRVRALVWRSETPYPPPPQKWLTTTQPAAAGDDGSG